jgi:hypothetical protein
MELELVRYRYLISYSANPDDTVFHFLTESAEHGNPD